ncbi:MAG: hypothetical protein JWL97_3562 [Gemmatimonadales bacterium]|nr:hypothetical protein [Gemmatimonadales bacterium]
MREVVVDAHQGLAVGGPAETGYVKSTLPYVPGSTLRGALAAGWIRDNGPPTRDNPRRAEFIEIFEGNVRYGPLFQEGTSLRPLSAAFCKYPADDTCRSWGLDAAIDAPTSHCPHCCGAIDRGKGEITERTIHHVTRTALDELGRAAEGKLCTRHELARGLQYRGRIAGDHPWLEGEHEVWIGGRTSTSGRATVRTTPMTQPPPRPSVREDGALVLRFASPVLIVDDAGRPSLDPVPELLAALGVEGTTEGTWVRPSPVGGWHAASGLPKPIEISIAMGSVVVVRPAEAPAPDRMVALARDGIGLRRVEGFGSVEINPVPWRPAAPEPAEDATSGGSLLDPLDELGLLTDPTTVRWILDIARQSLLDHERGVRTDWDSISTERVAIYLSDEQFSAVQQFMDHSRLPAAITLLQFTLERMEADS